MLLMLSLSPGVAALPGSCAEEPCGVGTCQETEGHLICLCPPGHSGTHCSIGQTHVGCGEAGREGGDSSPGGATSGRGLPRSADTQAS